MEISEVAVFFKKYVFSTPEYKRTSCKSVKVGIYNPYPYKIPIVGTKIDNICVVKTNFVLRSTN